MAADAQMYAQPTLLKLKLLLR